MHRAIPGKIVHQIHKLSERANFTPTKLNYSLSSMLTYRHLGKRNEAVLSQRTCPNDHHIANFLPTPFSHDLFSSHWSALTIYDDQQYEESV